MLAAVIVSNHMDGEDSEPRLEPAIIILLNVCGVKLTSKYLCLFPQVWATLNLVREASCSSRKQLIVRCITGKNAKEKRHKQDISINHHYHSNLRNAMEENTERM